MGFVNRELKENERREYVLKEKVKDYKYSNYIAKFDSGTIDNENDVRMFIYGDAMKSYESPFWDMNDFHTKYGILDYKGESTLLNSCTARRTERIIFLTLKI